MKFIDNEGRLFGKINLIDLFIVVFLLSLTPMFYFTYKIFNKRHPVTETKIFEQPEQVKLEQPEKEFIEIRVKGKLVKVKPEVRGLISIGDKEWDSSGKLIGEITELGEFEPYILKIKIASGKQLHRQNPDLKQATVILKITAQLRENHVYYKNFRIFEGDTLDFCNEKYTVTVDELLISDNLGQ